MCTDGLVRLLTALVLIFVAGISGQSVTTGPLNVAASLGNLTYLNCTTSGVIGTNFYWEKLNAESAGDYLYVSGQNTTLDPVNYGIEMPTSGQYNLIVKNVQASQGTKYWCGIFPNSATNHYAELIVVGNLNCPASLQQVISGNSVVATCSVAFYGNLVPTLTWSTSAGVMASQFVNNGSIVTASVNFTATPMLNMAAVTCTLSFTGGASLFDINSATNNPTYTSQCSTYYAVLHPVTEIQFEPPTGSNGVISQAMPVGSLINCTTNGSPAPVCVWQPVGNQGEVLTGQVLTITDAMAKLTQPVTYNVSAANTFNGSSYGVQQTITFTVAAASSESVQSAGVQTWVIVVAVVVPIVVIVAVVLGFCCYRRHASKESKNEKVKEKTVAPLLIAETEGPTLSPPAAITYAAPRSGGPDPYVDNQLSRAASPIGYGDIGGRSLGGSVGRINLLPTGAMMDSSIQNGSSVGSRASTPLGRGVPQGVSMVPDPRAAPRNAPPSYGNEVPRQTSLNTSNGSGSSSSSSGSSSTSSTQNFAPLNGSRQDSEMGRPPQSRAKSNQSLNASVV